MQNFYFTFFYTIEKQKTVENGCGKLLKSAISIFANDFNLMQFKKEIRDFLKK